MRKNSDKGAPYGDGWLQWKLLRFTAISSVLIVSLQKLLFRP